LEQAGVNEGIAADILGHEKQTMTYGLYSAGTNPETEAAGNMQVSISYLTTEESDAAPAHTKPDLPARCAENTLLHTTIDNNTESNFSPFLIRT
jgi:hypothetical protein